MSELDFDLIKDGCGNHLEIVFQYHGLSKASSNFNLILSNLIFKMRWLWESYVGLCLAGVLMGLNNTVCLIQNYDFECLGVCKLVCIQLHNGQKDLNTKPLPQKPTSCRGTLVWLYCIKKTPFLFWVEIITWAALYNESVYTLFKVYTFPSVIHNCFSYWYLQ